MPIVNKTEVLSEDAIAKINELYEIRFTGSLRINTSRDRLNWKIYFRLGRIIWAKGGTHSNLRWRRYSHLIYRPHFKQIVKETAARTNRQYAILIGLHKLANSIQKDNLVQLVKNIVAEILFDIIQYSVVGEDKFSYEVSAKDNLGNFMTLLDTEEILTKTLQTWIEWEESNLSTYSPNEFPSIDNPNLFQHKLSPSKYQYLIPTIDGTTSLRTLALKNNLNLIELSQFLVELSKIGAIKLLSTPKSIKLNVPIIIGSETTNLSSYYQKNLIVSPPASSESQTKSSQPLIVGVDDSLFICQGLGKIITRAGYRFIGIQDPVKAMLIILNNKPDLIFLDVLMPVISGYELCSQLKKNPQVQNIPVIILTSKDKLGDRIKAKLVGASGFLGKPTKPQEILETIHKYLPIKIPINSRVTKSPSTFTPKA